jgi:ribosomal protein L40E
MEDGPPPNRPRNYVQEKPILYVAGWVPGFYEIRMIQNNMEGNMSTSDYKPGARPGFITFLAVVMIIGGVLATLFQLFFIMGRLGFNQSMVGMLMTLGIGAAVLSFVTAYGLLNGRNWARKFCVISVLLNIITSLISIGRNQNMLPGALIAIIMAILIIYNLYTERSNRFFNDNGEAPHAIPAMHNWLCTRCSTYNPLSASSCIKCATRRPESRTEPAYNPQVASPVYQALKSASGGWICKKCGAGNDKVSSFCSGCGGYK